MGYVPGRKSLSFPSNNAAIYDIDCTKGLNVVIMCQGIIFKARLEVDGFGDEAMNAIAVPLA